MSDHKVKVASLMQELKRSKKAIEDHIEEIVSKEEFDKEIIIDLFKDKSRVDDEIAALNNHSLDL